MTSNVENSEIRQECFAHKTLQGTKTKEKLARSSSSSLPTTEATTQTPNNGSENDSHKYSTTPGTTEVPEKRRFSWDFLRRGSKAKFDLLKNNGENSGSTTSLDSRTSKDSSPGGGNHETRRRSSTRMEGKGSELAAWCIG